jgi:hypothetical protein
MYLSTSEKSGVGCPVRGAGATRQPAYVRAKSAPERVPFSPAFSLEDRLLSSLSVWCWKAARALEQPNSGSLPLRDLAGTLDSAGDHPRSPGIRLQITRRPDGDQLHTRFHGPAALRGNDVGNRLARELSAPREYTSPASCGNRRKANSSPLPRRLGNIACYYCPRQKAM